MPISKSQDVVRAATGLWITSWLKREWKPTLEFDPGSEVFQVHRTGLVLRSPTWAFCLLRNVFLFWAELLVQAFENWRGDVFVRAVVDHLTIHPLQQLLWVLSVEIFAIEANDQGIIEVGRVLFDHLRNFVVNLQIDL